MNSYDRYTGVLQGRPVDFLPRTPILMQYAAEYINADYAGFASDYRVLVEANLACATAFGIGDAIASQVSPSMYERLIQPREKQLIQAIKNMGAYVKLHICGDITHLLPGIANLDIDILNVDHMVDMRTARDAMGTNVALAGNIDPVGGILQGSTETIRKHVLETYAIVGNPFIVNAGCEIPVGTPPENLKTLCKPIHYVAE